VVINRELLGIALKKQYGLVLTETQVSQIEKFITELLLWNREVNLTRIVEPEDVVYKHIVDSLGIHRVLSQNNILPGKTVKLIDVGTGAGFPGIPIKIVYPWLEVTLLDSVNKKMVFVEHIIKTLSLTGVKTYTIRAEDAGKQNVHARKYDIVTARAVAKPCVIVANSINLVKPGGILVVYQTKVEESEQVELRNQLNRINAKLTGIVNNDIVTDKETFTRNLVVITKT